MSIENLKVNGMWMNQPTPRHPRSPRERRRRSIIAAALLVPAVRLPVARCSLRRAIVSRAPHEEVMVADIILDPFADDVGDTQPKNYVHIRIQRK
jgi:hypothetical protein